MGPELARLPGGPVQSRWQVRGVSAERARTQVCRNKGAVAGSEIRKETGPEPVATVAFTLGEIRSHLTYCFDQVPLVVSLRTDSRDERKRRPVGGATA